MQKKYFYYNIKAIVPQSLASCLLPLTRRLILPSNCLSVMIIYQCCFPVFPLAVLSPCCCCCCQLVCFQSLAQVQDKLLVCERDTLVSARKRRRERRRRRRSRRRRRQAAAAAPIESEWVRKEEEKSSEKWLLRRLLHDTASLKMRRKKEKKSSRLPGNSENHF